MSKTPKNETPAKQTTAVTNYNYGAAAGSGMEDLNGIRPEVPFLGLLQSLSPEVQDGDAKQITGAKPGMFLNSLTRELLTSIDCVVASVKLVYNEWQPRASGGGFVRTLEADSGVVQTAKAEAKKTNKPYALFSAEGNDLVETYVVFLVLIDGDQPTSPAIMTFTKTKIRRLQQAMSRITTFRGAKDIPVFAHALTLRATREKNKAQQTYYNVEFVPRDGDVATSLLPAEIDGVTNPIISAAVMLREAIQSGDVGANFAASAEAQGTAEAKDPVF